MRRPAFIIALAIPFLGGCTVAGDILSPHRELRARCSPANATPITQTGLRLPGLTTDPVISQKGTPKK